MLLIPKNSYSYLISIINLHVHIYCFTFYAEIIKRKMRLYYNAWIFHWAFWMVILIKLFHCSEFYLTDSWKFDVHTCHLLFDHSQFIFIHELNILGSYEISFFSVSNFILIHSHIHNTCCFSSDSISSSLKISRSI